MGRRNGAIPRCVLRQMSVIFRTSTEHMFAYRKGGANVGDLEEDSLARTVINEIEFEGDVTVEVFFKKSESAEFHLVRTIQTTAGGTLIFIGGHRRLEFPREYFLGEVNSRKILGYKITR